jgi:cytochrome c553
MKSRSLALWAAAMLSCAAQAQVPEWVYPLNPPDPGGLQPPETQVLRHVPRSPLAFTAAQLSDRFSAPGWFPGQHSPMPPIVAEGRRPSVFACGYCHTPAGQGRPENASLAGLPAAYIIQQVADFKSGARRSGWSGPYGPTDGMIQLAAHVTADEVAAAAVYFSRQRPISRVRVLQSDVVPRSRVVGWVYAAVPNAGDEPLGERMMEFAPDPERHELRDDRMQYVAYVPRGSVKRGQAIALKPASPTACASCHGKKLKGAGLIPRLAGRSPTYLIRQLLAFQTGARSSVASQPMQPVAAGLRIDDMIDVVSYAASLPP